MARREGATAPSRRPYNRPAVATEPATIAAAEGTGFEAVAEREHAVGVGPWKLAGRRLRRNKVALAFGALFLLFVAVAIAAPLWANDVAHTDAATNHLTETLKEGNRSVDVVALQGIPIGPAVVRRRRQVLPRAPTANGRDIMVRLLYGARTSLEIGVIAALITTILAVINSAPGRLSARDRRHDHRPGDGHRLGVPGRDPRRGPRHRALDRRAEGRADQHPKRLARSSQS